MPKVKQEEVVLTPEQKVPFKNTTAGKTIRTLFQSAAGMLLIFALSPEFRDFVTNNYPQLTAYVPLAVALFTALQNGLDPNVKNY